MLASTITPIVRALRAIDWAALTAADPDLHVYLYEQFLRVDAPTLRRSSGTYYTPVPLADTMVRLIDRLLRTHFDAPAGSVTMRCGSSTPQWGPARSLLRSCA